MNFRPDNWPIRGNPIANALIHVGIFLIILMVI